MTLLIPSNPISAAPQLLRGYGIQLIGITGHARVGKDTAADWIEQTYTDIYTESFADPLKRACSEAFGIPLSDFYISSRKELTNPYWESSPREIAQFVGTELFRTKVGQDHWINRMYGKLTGLQRSNDDGDYCAGDTVIIPDVRFQNEYDFIASHGGIIIHLTRDGADGTVGIPNHASEEGIKQFHSPEVSYHVSNNGTKEELYDKIKQILANSELKLTHKSIVSNL